MERDKVSLQIVGVISEDLLKRFASIVNYKENKNQVVLFCRYSESNIPIGFIFRKIQDVDSGEIFAIEATLKGISQQLRIPWEEVPMGWKTICNFEFKNNIPKVVSELKRLNDWFDYDKILVFS